jgi:hypothetical protein
MKYATPNSVLVSTSDTSPATVGSLDKIYATRKLCDYAWTIFSGDGSGGALPWYAINILL